MLNHSPTIWISVIFLILSCTRAEEEHHKRVPSGFTGVRGKKSIPDNAYNSEEGDNGNSLKTYDSILADDGTPSPFNYLLEKRTSSGFAGMRGRKPWQGANYPEGMPKRAPMGFVGMRGKKDDGDDDFGFDEPLKRSPMGFFGMRGKKYLIRPSYQGDKRAPMGFVGMRGKKEYENPSGYFDDKRAPSGFFGMRGKKQPSGFFGMRGKKYPYEFRGKFVGVRGKKSANDVDGPIDRYLLESNLDQLGQDLDFNQLMLLLTEQNEAESNENRLSNQ